MTPEPEKRSASRGRAALLVVALSGVSVRSVPAQPAYREWTIDPAASRLTVHVLPAGLLSSALHDHRFQPETWSGEIRWDPAHPESVSVEVRIAADSLRDHQEKLSVRDVAKVEAQTRGPRVLDAAKFPSIRFEGRELSAPTVSDGGEVRGTLTGNLTAHGRTRPVQFPVQGRVRGGRMEATAAVKLKQSDFGIKPYSAALGSIAVRDEITVEISLVAIAHGESRRDEAEPSRAPSR